ncbi:hypothetical protein [Planctomyces sp. SH-PL14]|uniref:hypothetical protein n=1 Tax=Planctomyces sp. SH-PL14 TaxID=1632864 RepID=UPI00094671A4|nr:hypothetical protein [Planctomyces sp. SH-PL14]
MARLLGTLGLDVGHEEMHEHGISSWMFAATTDGVPFSTDGTARAQFDFRHVIHVVRDPLRVISSTVFTELPNRKVFGYMRRFIALGSSGGRIEQACRSYLGWNKLIESQSPDIRVQVEMAPDVLPEFLRKAGVEIVPSAVRELPPTNYNSRPHPSLSGSKIRSAIPQELWEELVEYARMIGYEITAD